MVNESGGEDFGVLDVEVLMEPDMVATLADLPAEEAEKHPALRTAVGFFLLRHRPGVDLQYVDFMLGKARIRGRTRLFVALAITAAGLAYIARKKHRRSQQGIEPDQFP